jgi:hypothetical protein
MSKIPASKIIRNIDKAVKDGKSTIFNDAIVGGRSFKVWGWSKADYDTAKAALLIAGYSVKEVVTPSSSYLYWVGGNTRLHVFG